MISAVIGVLRKGVAIAWIVAGARIASDGFMALRFAQKTEGLADLTPIFMGLMGIILGAMIMAKIAMENSKKRGRR